jgi:class 3 adenylate cyclase/ABC-type lipoprotein export system ATPase subunit
MSDLTLWLASLGLENYESALVGNDIDLTVVPDLTESDLEKLGLSLGHRRKFLAAASKLRTQAIAVSAAAASTVSPARSQPAPSAERRQLTVMFIDLVDSTVVGGTLDPEDLIVLLRRYREACLAAIARHDGFVAQYLGDGILVYFGFPLAQEDAAARAVRAGLDIVHAVERLKQPDGSPLRARVGIATGLVVVGETRGVGAAGEETVVGETPNLAARLQSLAEPSSVIVGPTTHRLTADFFEYSFLGEHSIKGFSRPVAVWKAFGESSAKSRFAASHAAGPIIGRERELAFLHDSWRRAIEGDGHVVLVAGEAGMGKSRLLEAFAERIRDERCRLLRCLCSPYHRNSALFPFRMLLRQELNISSAESPVENMKRIEDALAKVGQRARSSTLLLAELLEVPSEDKLSPTEMTANQRRDETLAILADILLTPLEGPVLLLLEDAHWSDKTTQTLVEQLLKRIEHESALVMISYRPELETTWPEHPHATVITCKQFGAEQCSALVRSVASQMRIDESLVQEIVKRSDGVPLFAAELTKAVLELQSAAPGAVPLTLRDSLMVRLDRLAEAKDVAQVASVIGRRFDYKLLAAIAESDDARLGAALERLCDSGLIFAAREGDDVSFSFNHVLVQEAAYESLSRNRRQLLHDRIARYLEELASVGDGEPTVIAHHFSRAGEAEMSFRFWMLAADRSDQRVALNESIANLKLALAEAERVGNAATALRLKLDAQLRLSATLVIQKGPKNAEAVEALQAAADHARRVNARPQLFQAMWGLYINEARNRRYDKAAILGDELRRISQDLGDPGLQYEALHHRWGLALFTGQTAKLLEYTAAGIERYDRDQHHRLSHVYAGHDPGVCAYCCRTLGLGLAGRARIQPTVAAAIDLATSLQHPLTLAFAYSIVAGALHLVGDLKGTRETAEQLVQVSTKYEFAIPRAVGNFLLGATRASEGDHSAALLQMEPVFEVTLGYGFLAMLPAVMMAEALVSVGRDKDALALVTRMLDELPTPEIGIFVSELWRLRGELVLRHLGNDARPEVERYLATALRIAQSQGAPVYNLRAGISLARLLAETGRRAQAGAVIDAAAIKELGDWNGLEAAIACQLISDVS